MPPEGKAAAAAAVESQCSDGPICSDRAAVPEGLQVRGPSVLEIPSVLVTQRRGVMPYMACHAKLFANPKGPF